MSSDLIESSVEMINQLYQDKNYREALNGLFLIKKMKPYGDSDKFNKIIENLIKCCITELKNEKKYIAKLYLKDGRHSTINKDGFNTENEARQGINTVLNLAKQWKKIELIQVQKNRQIVVEEWLN
jgi:hypothetical protein